MARNHVEILDAAGLKLDDIIAGWVYLRDMKDYQDMNAIYGQYFSKGPGVRSLLDAEFHVREERRTRADSFTAAKTR